MTRKAPPLAAIYNAILQNLFFATLNRAVEDGDGGGRRFATAAKKEVKTLYRYGELFTITEQEVVEMFSEVPFLNGGLFECLDKTRTVDGVERAYNLDGFSRNAATFADGRYRHRAVVPNVLFFAPGRGLFAILNRYNFTVEENTPEEQQVALDPELLGKVFENLLGAYNPETRETARNQSGSFYTPREIVRYMVDESLVSYLGDSEFVRSLFAADFEYDEASEAAYADVAARLRSVRILDPACGSGAFPMGLLNRMVEVLQRVAPGEEAYGQKLALIENCLYGSDIQRIAAQITKLRFFISLITDCERDVSKPNYGIPALPNLETKFVAADTLIALKGKTSIKRRDVGHQTSMEHDEIRTIKDRLSDVRREHFKATSASEKKKLREQDRVLREELLELLLDTSNLAQEDARQLVAWDPYDQNSVSPFFDPEWMFGIADGFDIVIGNPPYIQLQNNGGELAARYAGCGYETLARTGDIYCLFYERGWQLLKGGGHLCYITSNKWMRAGYGEKTRGFLAGKTNPLLLIDFAGVRIFESATVDTNILLFSRSSNTHSTRCAVTNRQNEEGFKNLGVFVQQQNVECDFATSGSWVILSPIEQSIKKKIEAAGTPLKDWDINIYRGVLTGYNDAFIIPTEKRNEILANCKDEDERKRTDELIRPILRGRDIRRYRHEWAELWLINTHNGVKGKLPRIRIEDYPTVKAHLDKYWDKISTRSDMGDTPYNLRNCAYMEDFFKPKIMYNDIAQKLSFAVTTDNEFLSNTIYFFKIEDTTILYYLLGILNSNIIDSYYRTISVQLGERAMRLFSIYMEQLPIPQFENTPLRNQIVELVKQRLQHNDSNIDELINRKVYNLYSLTEDEIAYIESD